jgi:P-type Cu+ transporter
MNTRIDPVCGMTVDPATAAGKFDYEGETYYFCNPNCLRKFSSDPQGYLNKAPQFAAMGQPMVQLGGRSGSAPVLATAKPQTETRTVREGAEYTCPMDPEVNQIGPGACPICGMALEPRVVALEEEENPELKDMKRRFWVSAALTLPVLLLAMSEMIPGQPVQHAVSPRLLTFIQFALATPVVLWGGKPFFQRGWASIVNRSPNMFTLIAIGTGAAWLYSVVATFLPNIFPASFRGHGGEVAVYF